MRDLSISMGEYLKQYVCYYRSSKKKNIKSFFFFSSLVKQLCKITCKFYSEIQSIKMFLLSRFAGIYFGQLSKPRNAKIV